MQIKTKIVISHTADSKPVKQEVNNTGILPPLVFPDLGQVFNSRCDNSRLCHAITNFVQLGFNEADPLKSSSILIYSHSELSIYTQSEWHDAVLIKEVIK